MPSCAENRHSAENRDAACHRLYSLSAALSSLSLSRRCGAGLPDATPPERVHAHTQSQRLYWRSNNAKARKLCLPGTADSDSPAPRANPASSGHDSCIHTPLIGAGSLFITRRESCVGVCSQITRMPMLAQARSKYSYSAQYTLHAPIGVLHLDSPVWGLCASHAPVDMRVNLGVNACMRCINPSAYLAGINSLDNVACTVTCTLNQLTIPAQHTLVRSTGTYSTLSPTIF